MARRKGLKSLVKELGFSSCEEYFQSDRWKELTCNPLVARACFCRGMGCNGDEIRVKVRHINFDHVGEETWDDLIFLCDNHHELVQSVVKTYKVRLSVAHLLVKEVVRFHNYKNLTDKEALAAIIADNQTGFYEE